MHTYTCICTHLDKSIGVCIYLNDAAPSVSSQGLLAADARPRARQDRGRDGAAAAPAPRRQHRRAAPSHLCCAGKLGARRGERGAVQKGERRGGLG